MGFSGTLGNMAKSQPSEKLSLARFESLLIKHGVIHEDAIEDYEGYDGGIMLEKVLRVFKDITGMLSCCSPLLLPS